MAKPKAYNKNPVQCPYNQEVTCHVAECEKEDCRFYQRKLKIEIKEGTDKFHLPIKK